MKKSTFRTFPSLKHTEGKVFSDILREKAFKWMQFVFHQKIWELLGWYGLKTIHSLPFDSPSQPSHMFFFFFLQPLAPVFGWTLNIDHEILQNLIFNKKKIIHPKNGLLITCCLQRRQTTVQIKQIWTCNPTSLIDYGSLLSRIYQFQILTGQWGIIDSDDKELQVELRSDSGNH